jgi:hypothetical protein
LDSTKLLLVIISTYFFTVAVGVELYFFVLRGFLFPMVPAVLLYTVFAPYYFLATIVGDYAILLVVLLGLLFFALARRR